MVCLLRRYTSDSGAFQVIMPQKISLILFDKISIQSKKTTP